MQAYRIPVPAVDFQPPTYICQRATKPFTLDGNINKDFWSDAPFTEDFQDIEGSIRPLPRFITRAKMLWDNENLYFGAYLEGSEIWATITKRDSVIFYDNDFEIFIDPDSDTQQYYEFEMNALNTIWDLFLTKAYRDGGKPLDCFDFHDIQTAVHIDGTLNDPSAANQGWSVEVVIPFASITECAAAKRPPINGEYYRINFSRVQWLVDIADNKYIKRTHPGTETSLPEDNWVYAPTGVVNIHYPELWSFVFFADSEHSQASFSIPEDELIQWELRKLYYAEHAIWDETGSFSKDLAELTSTLQRISPIVENASVRSLDYRIETTSHFFEISCPSSDKARTISIFADGKTQIH